VIGVLDAMKERESGYFCNDRASIRDMTKNINIELYISKIIN